MVPFILSALTLLPSVQGLCFSPLVHGFTPDIILPSVFGSGVHCPHPHVFDYIACMCVDSSKVVQKELSLLGGNRLRTKPVDSSRRFSDLVGGPDMHMPAPHMPRTWQTINLYDLAKGSRSDSSRSDTMSRSGSDSVTPQRRVVPVYNAYGSFSNIPANSDSLSALAAAAAVAQAPVVPSKQQELLEKARWRQQLQREEQEAARAAAAVAAVELAASAQARARQAVATSTLDDFMQTTLRRILYGY